MNTFEAYKIFELNQNCSLEEAKKKHKELVKKYHPDLDINNSSKMKEINQAFDIIKKHKENAIVDDSIEDIILHKHISFKEVVYGGTVNVNYDRLIHCETCGGEGKINNCKKCNGRGFITKTIKTNFGITTSQTMCSCKSENLERCSDCFGSGSTKTNVNLNVKIPPGIPNNGKLLLRNMGNFSNIKTIFNVFSGSYEDAILNITFDSNPDFSIVNNKLTTKINISYLESLEGFNKEIKLPDDSVVNIESNSHIDSSKVFNVKNKGIGYNDDLLVKVNIEPLDNDRLNKIIKILKNV